MGTICSPGPSAKARLPQTRFRRFFPGHRLLTQTVHRRIADVAITQRGDVRLAGYPGKLLLLFVGTTIVGILTTRGSIYLSHRLGILDRPSSRKVHHNPTAYLGGFGMLMAFLLGMIALLFLEPDLAILHQRQVLTVLAGAVAIFLVGFWDDVRPVKAILKLFLQIAVASGMWLAGVRIGTVSVGGGEISEINLLLSYGVTVGWYVALMNSINLVDGLDGLAGGISLIGAVSLVGVSMVIGSSPEVMIGGFLAILTGGAVLGFLVYNWHPAKTFMGDGGSLLLGFLLATASLIGSTKTPTVLALAVPLVALGLPLFESFFSFFRRAIRGQHPFKPDRRHLHHRLLDLGLDQRRVVIFLLFMTGFLGLNSIILAEAKSKLLFFNVVLIICGLVMLIENLKFLERKRSIQSTDTIVTAAAPAAPASEPAPAREGQLL